MGKKHFCQACNNEKYGIKTKVAVLHTCGRETEVKQPQRHVVEPQCPECLKKVDEAELKMFGGWCGECYVDSY